MAIFKEILRDRLSHPISSSTLCAALTSGRKP
ncbi:hypothetical protein GBAR_LOCUS7538 [Geodia barretti]|uniref:Uncharacterized protein n=1 Tax=Geodia barretti TaxID=519541 RepID=A0AA35W910_GEOBA|nr:hypothetical protein GBAR_LOCUS7538 [Geodia barretti]